MTKPNIIYIYADDLGRGMLSCYGQKLFKTPNIDRLANEGMKFTHAYGCALCAPARASLLTGYHDAHAGTWSFTDGGIYKRLSTEKLSLLEVAELINNTGIQDRPNDVYLAEIAKQAGYVTGEIGKLEWGFATTNERLVRHGWDYHYGYYDHVRCHGFYPPFLFENGEMVIIDGNTHEDCGMNPEGENEVNAVIRHNMEGKAVYSQDIFDRKIIEFLRSNKDTPFFLYHPSQLPHGPISIPEIHPSVRDVKELTEYEKEYASMVIRLDKTVGLILDEVERLGIAENTLIFFSSDNGHELYYKEEGRVSQFNTLDGIKVDHINTKYYSDTCGDIFDGNDGMAGIKRTNLEGGTRIPYIVRWPGQIAESITCEQIIANYDFMPTLAAITGGEKPLGKDGISFLPTLLGKDEEQENHEYVVYASFLGPALVTNDGWKVRYLVETDTYELYDIKNDYREECNLADKYMNKLKKLKSMIIKACDGNLTNGIINTHRVMYAE